MKIKDVLRENKEDELRQIYREYDVNEKDYSIVRAIVDDCEPFLREIKFRAFDFLNPLMIFSGRQGANAEYINKKVRLENRRPLSSEQSTHDAINDAFSDEFGAPFRDSLFVSSSSHIANTYGEVYAIYPIGDFKYLWSPKIDDMSIEFNHSEFYSDETRTEEENNQLFARHLIDNGNYQTTDLISAIESSNEIMIRCGSYYGIKYKNFAGNYHEGLNALFEYEIGVGR